MDKAGTSTRHAYERVAMEVEASSSSAASVSDASRRFAPAPPPTASRPRVEETNAVVGTVIVDGGDAASRRKERWFRNCVRVSLTLLYIYMLWFGTYEMLFRRRYKTFGPGEAVERQRRQHCNKTAHFRAVIDSDEERGVARVNVTTTTTETHAVKGVFVLLIRGHADVGGYASTRKWLEHVMSRMPWIRKHDVIFFHEGDVKEEHQRYLMTGEGGVATNRTGEAANVKVPIEFVDLSSNSTTAFTIPPWIPKYYGKFPARLGYLHMCRFYSVLLFPMLWDKYEYVFRLDDDVYLAQKVETDLFEAMNDRGLLYLYGSEVPEWNKHTRSTFGPWLYMHLLQTRRTGDEHYKFVFAPSPREIWWELGADMFFTNFFLSRLDWWKQTHVQHLLSAIDMSGNIYYHRWGDAPIHTVVLRLFADVCEVVPLCDVSYYHSSTGHLIERCTARNEDRPERFIEGVKFV